ncbi:MAG: hypothetical protein AAAC50_07240 [Rhizobium altiplani]|uniref:DUF6894 family protein n=1 Tax=Rhizobium altiplani TaxID=1864509 RepID=UPI000DD794A4
MTRFYFRTGPTDTPWQDEDGYEFPDLPAALDEAKRLVAEMAIDGIPTAAGEPLEVEIYNPDRVKIVTVSLHLSIEYAGGDSDR